MQQVAGLNERQRIRASHNRSLNLNIKRHNRRIVTQDIEVCQDDNQVGSHNVVTQDTATREALDYHRQIRRHITDVTYMRNELHDAARTDATHKLQVLCGVIMDTNQDLSAQKWLGDKFGESSLAVAVAHNNMEAARQLINIGKSKLILKTYATPKFQQMTCLHLAIIRQNVDLVDTILGQLNPTEKKSLLELMASGLVNQDYLTTPLPLAVNTGNLEVVYTLLNHGVDLMGRDIATGNTIVHFMAEIGDKSPMKAIEVLDGIVNSDAAGRWWKRQDQLGDTPLADVILRMRNDAGHTPLSYAVHLGATEYAAAIIELGNSYSFARWDVDPEHENWYEVSEIDPAVATYEHSPYTILEMFTYFTSDRNVTLGELPQIKKVIENKWRNYKCWVIAWFILHTLVMVSFTIYCTRTSNPPFFAVFINENRSTFNETGTISQGPSIPAPTHLPFNIMEVFVVFVALVYLAMDIYDSITTISRHCLCNFTKPGANADLMTRIKLSIQHFDLLRAMLFIFSFSVPSMFFLRIVDSPKKDIFYALAAVSGWLFMLFFIRALKNIGIFTAIVYRMILREITYIIIIVSIVIVAYGTGLYCLFNLKEGQSQPTQVLNPFEIYFYLTKVVVGLDEFDILDHTTVPWLGKLLFVVFIILCQILLLNVLIAAMNNTYNELSEMKEIIWLQILCKSILSIERRLPRCIRPKHGLEKIARGQYYEHMWYLGCEVTEKDRPWKKL